MEGDPAGPVLKFSAGRLERPIATSIIVLQIILALAAALLFLFWLGQVLGSLYHPRMLRDGTVLPYLSVDLYPDLLALAILTAIPVYLLHHLYTLE